MTKLPGWMKYGMIIGVIIIVVGTIIITIRTDWEQEIVQIDTMGTIVLITGIIVFVATCVDFSYLEYRDRDSRKY